MWAKWLCRSRWWRLHCCWRRTGAALPGEEGQKLFVKAFPFFTSPYMLCRTWRATKLLPPDFTFIVMRIIVADCCIVLLVQFLMVVLNKRDVQTGSPFVSSSGPCSLHYRCSWPENPAQLHRPERGSSDPALQGHRQPRQHPRPGTHLSAHTGLGSHLHQ